MKDLQKGRSERTGRKLAPTTINRVMAGHGGRRNSEELELRVLRQRLVWRHSSPQAFFGDDSSGRRISKLMSSNKVSSNVKSGA